MELTRKELYDLVWAEPMTTICKRFGLSDNGLRKHCKSMNIPTPPAGYWAKIKFGKKVKIIPLRKIRKLKNKVQNFMRLIRQNCRKALQSHKSAEIKCGNWKSGTAICLFFLFRRFCMPKTRSLLTPRRNSEGMQKTPT